MLEPHQIELAEKATVILKKLHIVYLSMEPRVGKTRIAMQTCQNLGFKKVLFLTEKKGIADIQEQFNEENFTFEILIINYEQLHNLRPGYECLITDEAHRLGSYTNKYRLPNKSTAKVKALIQNSYLILASGTPSPEGYALLYYQFWMSAYTPFAFYKNFLKWAHEFINIKKKWRGGLMVNDYQDAYIEKIMDVLQPYFLSYTREQVGFTQAEIIEEIKYVDMDIKTNKLIKTLINQKYYQLKNGSEIVCDTAVKLQLKIHQICSGTVIDEEGRMLILDKSKMQYILDNYQNEKIAIFYNFIAEGELLKSAIPNWTDSPEIFNSNPSKIFIAQIRTGSTGIDLSSAAKLIFYNIAFSSVQYQQAKNRILNMKRETPPIVHFIFARGGIETRIYKVVQQKKSYTSYYFKKDFLKRAS